jgi:solute carrier family 13 (sodium-dependent dicarboxylate transporter), member 2/3/5
MNRLVVVLIMVVGLAGLMFGLEAERDVIAALCILWIIAVLWLTEALHITLTALLAPILAAATGLLDVTEATKNFAHPIIFLFLGGFTLAIAMHVQGLDKWLADEILKRTRGRLDRAVLMLAGATAVISMWISNTATTALMLPLILGLMAEKEDLPPRTQVFSLLVIAYSANLGGIGTIIGTAPNALVAAQLDISFLEWLKFGVPAVALLWPLMVTLLWWLLKPDFLDNRVVVDHSDFVWTTERRLLIAIFAVTVSCWLFSKPLSALLHIESNFDTWVALSAMVMVGVTRVATWQQLEKSTEWGVLLLFGGGLTLSEILKTSGASAFLGIGLANVISGWGMVLILVAVVSFVVFLTEVSSNTATTALLVPVFIALPAGIIEPAMAAIAIGVASSCAFMLPVATPPNALVHGTGKVSQRAMMHAGVYLNVLCIIVLAFYLSVIKLPN